jgi:hypothetical protein
MSVKKRTSLNANEVAENTPATHKRTYKKTAEQVDSANQDATRGSAIIESFQDPHRRRGAYVMLQRAISLALDVPFDAMKVACMTAVKDLANPDDRIRSRAREFLLKVQESGIGASVDLDRVQRLDDGMATENISVASITPEALSAVVQTIRQSCK